MVALSNSLNNYMRNLAMRRNTILRTLFSVLVHTMALVIALAMALTLTISCSSGGGAKPTLSFDETPLGDNRSKFIITSDVSEWSALAGSWVLMCKSANLTVDRGFKYFYMDEQSSGTQTDSRPSFRLAFYRSPPEMPVMDITSGKSYQGDWLDGKKNGHGTMIWRNGDRYEGDWVDDKAHGHGIGLWAYGARYEGDWRDGKQRGNGSIVWPDGSRYDGAWRDGYEHGHGIGLWANGDRYEGDWLNGYKNGHGTLVKANGDRYEGEWSDGNVTTSSGIYKSSHDLAVGHLSRSLLGEIVSFAQYTKMGMNDLNDPMTSVIEAEPLDELCDALESQDYRQAEELLQR